MTVTRSHYSFSQRLAVFFVAVILLFLFMPQIEAQADASDYGYDLPWLWPVPGSYRLNSLDYYFDGGLHNQGQCIDVDSNGHYGSNRLDIISATTGTVFYIRDGYNESSNKGSGWGNYVIVRSGDIYIVYAHLQSISCTYGPIKAGELIGKMGNTGNSTGVHLHLQAYPVNAAITNTSIPVFEQYRTNPLYVEQFKFLKGLKAYSVRYKSWITDYYKTSSGVYYSYSGGLSSELPVVSASSSVTVINTAGAPVRSSPIASNSYIVDTLPHGTTVDILGYYTDAYGDSWLLLSDSTDGKRWILSSDVGFSDYVFRTDISNAMAPEGEFGAFVDLSFGGMLTSANTIESYTAKILKGDEVVAAYQHPIGSSSYTIGDEISGGLGIETLGNGDYTYQLSVLETASYPNVDPVTKEHTILTTQFSINAELSDKIPPFVESVAVRSVTTESVELVCYASDNKNLQRVSFILSATNGSFTKTLNAARDGDCYRLTVSAEELGGSQSYQVTAVAYDGYGNTDSGTASFFLPANGSGEVWKVTTNLRIRSGPGTSYGQTGMLTAGLSVTVDRILMVVEGQESYTWGHYTNGWIALDFCTYQSGYLYTVGFDLNGGTGEQPPILEKRYGVAVSLPDLSPEREGYTFLGWANASDAKTADYPVGTAFSGNASTTLFAVWEDSVPPVISEVTVSTTDWTKDPVTVTVSASDNTGTVLYSFDGGLTWVNQPSIVLTENAVIAPKTIAVKDLFGNVVYHTEPITVSHIDTVPPDVSSASVSISPSEAGVSVLTEGIIDHASGIHTQTLWLSATKDLASAIPHPLTDGQPLSLEDGVYYARLTVTDLAGNESILEVPRFLVGEKTPLRTAMGLTVTHTASTAASFLWEPVEHADAYRVTLYMSDPMESLVFTVADEAYTVTGLTPHATYFFTVTALANDDVFLPSEECERVSFVTLNDDTSIYAFPSLRDAEIDISSQTISYVVPYAEQSLDLTATLGEGATVSYYADSSTSVSIENSASYSFTEKTVTLYLLVTAENGDTQPYTLTLTRAEKQAAAPIVTYQPKDFTSLVGDSLPELTLNALSPDGGTLSVVWYGGSSNAIPEKLGEGNCILPPFTASGSYILYAVVTNHNEKCETTITAITTNNTLIMIQKRESPITVICNGYVFNGNTPTVMYDGYDGDGEISYRFFSDSACNAEIAPPVNAGEYYVVAYAAETDTYLPAASSALRFTIAKVENTTLPSPQVQQPVLRDRNGYLTVTQNGLEYRVGNTGSFAPLLPNTYTYAPGTSLEIRFSETENQKVGPVLTVTFFPFDGTEAILPKDDSALGVSNGYLLVNLDNVKASDIINALEKTENITLYSSDHVLLNGTDQTVLSGTLIAVEDELGIYTSLTVLILGDFDNNGHVDASDVTQILRFANGTKTPSDSLVAMTADLDGDGAITIKDAYLAVLRT